MSALGLALLAGTPAALAQSVTGTGDINPAIPGPPLPNWSLGSADLIVGDTGTGTLTIEAGGTVSNAVGYVGSVGGSTGTVTVTGTGSTWTNSGVLNVGWSGSGRLTIADGGQVSNTGSTIGGGVDGSVTVTGAGSTWTIGGNLSLYGSGSGTGTLRIEDGGAVFSNAAGFIGSGSGSSTVTVTGAGSTWTNTYNLMIGMGGTGTLIIADGGAVSNSYTHLGWSSGSTGSAIVTGAGSNWTHSGEIYVGSSSNGTLTIVDGGKVSNTFGIIGNSSGSTGEATVTGTGSTWTNSGSLSVGRIGAGTLTIEAGGQVSNTIGYIGRNAGGSGTATVTGTGSTWTNSAELYVGYNGTGTLTIADGGTVTSAGNGGFIGELAGSTGTVTVTGAGSSWSNNNVSAITGELHIGTAGTGTLIVEDGGAVRSTSGYIGFASGGSGTVTVTGTGSRWVVDGLLDVGRDGTGTLTIADGGTILNTTSAYIGAGGTVNLSGDATHGRGVLELNFLYVNSGTLNLNGGILRARSNQSAFFDSAGGQTIGANGAFFDSNGYDIGVPTNFDGSGGLTKLGTGTLTLSGANSYTGETVVAGGTLRAGQTGSFPASSAFTVGAGATLDFSGFDQSLASLAGAGTVTMGSGNLTTGSNNASTIFSGTITGTGGLTKTGTGTLTLAGTNTYTGATRVESGKLVVNGSLASSVVLAGGTLGGSGTIGAVSVASGATVAPGNSIGTLAVSGNFAFANGSIYQVEVNAAGQSDKIVASGSVTISGGTVEVLAASGNYAASTHYTILTASGGVSGSFSNVTSNLAFLTPSLSYGGNDVTLNLARNATSFVDAASTRNQALAANAAERLGAGHAVYDALLSATAAEARAGFDLISGEAHAQTISVMIDESRLARDTVLDHLRGPLLTRAPGQVAASFSADLPGRKDIVTMPAPIPQSRYALWGTAFGSTGNTDRDGNAASLDRDSGGALLGADLIVYDDPGSALKLGLAGGYSQSRFALDARLSSGSLESGHGALYAGARFGNLRLDAGAAYSWSESDVRRQIQIRGFSDVLRLQNSGSVMQGFAELGYGFTFQGFALEPFAQMALIRVSTDTGTERGGAAALRLLSSDQTLGFTTLGLRAEAQIGDMPLFARAMFGWRHGFGELTPQASTVFVAGATPAQVFAAPIDREALVAEAGLDWRISQATALGLSYSAAIGERARDHTLKGRVEMRF